MDKITLLIDGKAAFSRILKNINESKHSIDVTMFIWRNDQTGVAIAKALLAAAERGVRVHIDKDMVGWVFERGEENKSGMLHARGRPPLQLRVKTLEMMYDTLRRIPLTKDVAVRRFFTHPNIVIRSAMRWDHTKCYVFDDKVLITGGMNIEQKHITHDMAGNVWRDYMVEIRDAGLVRRLRRRIARQLMFDAKLDIEFVSNNRELSHFEIQEVVLYLLDRTKRRVELEMAYLGWTKITQRLVQLANSGKDVTVLLPSKANVQHNRNMLVARKMINSTKGKINILLCKDMLHAKALLIDGEIAFLGSANFNGQGLHNVGELDVCCKEKSFVKALALAMSSHRKNAMQAKDGADLPYSRVKALPESWIG